jgi:hypothetical protein
MNVEVTGTLVGYDVESGAKLFTHTNRPIRLSDKTSSLPHARDYFTVDGKHYQVIGVRQGSTEIFYEIDVREEAVK